LVGKIESCIPKESVGRISTTFRTSEESATSCPGKPHPVRSAELHKFMLETNVSPAESSSSLKAG
jgi:hypothetical protein